MQFAYRAAPAAASPCTYRWSLHAVVPLSKPVGASAPMITIVPGLTDLIALKPGASILLVYSAGSICPSGHSRLRFISFQISIASGP